MRAVVLVIGVGWVGFWLYWLIAAFSVKRGRAAWSRHARVRIAIVVVVVVLIRTGLLRGDHLARAANSNLWLGALGVLLFAAGLALAIWARVHIGRNWGTPMSRKDEPELITSGPYRWVRHPIYTGILLAGIGSALALNLLLIVLVAAAGGYFVTSAVVEERNLTEAFPDAYPRYKASSKMLVPFLF